jgi:predicted RNA-binding Zn ribbon-like protein
MRYVCGWQLKTVAMALAENILAATRLPLLGGNVCLDFINTAEFRGSDRAIECLASYQHVLAWCVHVGLIDAREAQRLMNAATRQPAQEQKVLAQIIQTREALYRIFAALAQKKPPGTAALKPLNTALAQIAGQRQLIASADGVAWRWTSDSARLDPMLAPLTLAAADLLTSADLQKLRQCPGCGWLFLDTSRNHMRRWCSMAFCGSQDKSRRQYARKLADSV